MRKKNWIEFNNNNIKIKDIDDKVFEKHPQKLIIFKERKGKKGKTVTVITGFQSQNSSHTAALLRKLKVYCGTGGSLNEQGIQLQGDMQDKVKFFLLKEGYSI